MGTKHFNKDPTTWYEINTITNCWLWLGRLDKDGYGHISIGSKKLKAHRYMFECFHKRDIEKGKQIDHLCKTRHCVNPEHLEEVLPVQNVRRGAGTKLTAEIVKQIRADNLKPSQRASKYNISKRMLYSILNYSYWKDV